MVVVEVASSAEAEVSATAIRDLAVACFPADFLDGGADAATIVDALCGFHDAAACEFLLARDGAALVAMATVIPYHDALYVATLCVAPARRRSGLARVVCRVAAAHARDLGLDRLTGTVDPSRGDLRALYASGLDANVFNVTSTCLGRPSPGLKLAQS